MDRRAEPSAPDPPTPDPPDPDRPDPDPPDPDPADPDPAEAAPPSVLGALPPYEPRPIRFRRLARIDGWRLKVYTISAGGAAVDDSIVEAALERVGGRLPRPAVRAGGSTGLGPEEADRYGVGIVIVHEAREGVFLLLSWWTGENMLRHHVFVSPRGPVPDFEEAGETGIAACVWELAVLAHEGRAWREEVLEPPGGPRVEAYLDRRLSTDL